MKLVALREGIILTRRGRTTDAKSVSTRLTQRRASSTMHDVLLTRSSKPIVSFKLRLYVSGRTPRAQRTIDSVRVICDTEIAGDYELDIIDVLEHPELVEADRILATPTLVRRAPEPVRMIIGDLGDAETVLHGLGIASSARRALR